METQPDAADARRALDEITQVRAQAAARKRTPWWLWQILGLLAFGWVASYALPKSWANWVSLALLVSFVVASGAVARRTGFGPFEGSRWGRWGAVVWSVSAFGLVLGAVLLHKNGAGPWVLFLAGVIVYACFVILGPISERHFGAPTQALS